MSYLNGMLAVLMAASAYPILKMRADSALQLPLAGLLILLWAGILYWLGNDHRY